MSSINGLILCMIGGAMIGISAKGDWKVFAIAITGLVIAQIGMII